MQYLIDMHAHFYPAYSVSQFWNSALVNFKKYQTKPEACFCLVLLETDSAISAEAFCDRIATELEAQIETYAGCYRVKHNQEQIVIFSGIQLVSVEGLEVLGLFDVCYLHNKQTLRDTVNYLVENDAVVVLPWSFGKWWGKRAKILRDFLADKEIRSRLFLGDIVQRATVFGTLESRFKGGAFIGTLAGSDSLALPGDECRVGQLLTRFEADAVDFNHLTQHLRRMLGVVPILETVGQRDSIIRLVMRWWAWKLFKGRSK